MEDYDCSLNYHPEKANVVADPLSRKVQVASLMVREWHMLEEVSVWNPRLEPQRVIFGNITVKSTLLDRIKKVQKEDPKVQKWVEKVQKGEKSDFNLGTDGVLKFMNRLMVPKDEGLKKEILNETHRSKYTVHPGGNKMYQDLKSLYWWENMKREIAQFGRACLICQQVKVEYQKPSELLQPLEILSGSGRISL